MGCLGDEDTENGAGWLSGTRELVAIAIAAPTSMICAFGLAKELLVYGTDEIIAF